MSDQSSEMEASLWAGMSGEERRAWEQADGELILAWHDNAHMTPFRVMGQGVSLRCPVCPLEMRGYSPEAIRKLVLDE